jgi:hypothetical protein
MSLNFQRFFASLSAQCANLAGARRGKVASARSLRVSKKVFPLAGYQGSPGCF